MTDGGSGSSSSGSGSGSSNPGTAHTHTHAQTHRVVCVEAPIRSPPPTGIIAMVIGAFLVLHTPAWILLVSYRDAIGSPKDSESSATATVTVSTHLLRCLSRWLLEFTPWLANALLSIFLGGLFLYMGLASLRGSDRR